MIAPVPSNSLADRVRAHHRVALAKAAAVSAGLATAALTSQSLWVGAWLAGSGVYLALALHALSRLDAVETRTSAQWDDAGAQALSILVPVLAWFSLAALLHAAQGCADLAPEQRSLAVFLALASIGLAWLVVQASTGRLTDGQNLAVKCAGYQTISANRFFQQNRPQADKPIPAGT